jgi:hypothetical protein
MYKLPTENLYCNIKKIFLYTFLILISFNNFSLSDLSEDAVDELILKAEENDINAQYLLHDHYLDLEKYEEALFWGKEAAKLGNAFAQNNLGFMYDNGLGTEENKKLAYQWFLKASEQNQVNALTTIASYYLNGDVVSQNYVKAFKFYKKAANMRFEDSAWFKIFSDYEIIWKNNQSRAIYALGLMHEKGQGTRYNYEKAKEFYLKADEYGHEISKLRYDALEGDALKAATLASYYLDGSQIDTGIPIDLAEAAFWFKVAEYKGANPYPEKFDEVNKKLVTNETDMNKAFDRFVVWKKNLGFEDDKETLLEITPYYITHTGTAFYVNETILLTNKHVAFQDENFNEKCDRIVGFAPYKAKYEIYEHFNTDYLAKWGDVEILVHKKGNKSFIPISDRIVKAGMDIFVLGFPHGDEISKYPKISRGIVNSEIGFNNNFDEFIFDATSYHGSSGSPVLDKNGKLVGILYGGYEYELKNKIGESENFVPNPTESYGLKSNYLKKFLKGNDIQYNTYSNPIKNYLIGLFQKIFKTRNTDATKIAEDNIPNLRLIECYKKW